MHVIVVGCGRVGSSVAADLDADGHMVVIIDTDRQSFRRLPDDFGGVTIVGLALDRATLEKAGIEDTDALVAVTSGDNSNIVSARIAKQTFGVTNVIARIYDPERALIYERHGITTIASARWTTDTILGNLHSEAQQVETAIGPGEGDVVVLSHLLPEGGPWDVGTFAEQGHWLLAAVSRVGQTTVPVPRQLVQSGERVHLAVQRGSLERAEAFLNALAPATGGES